MLKKQSEELTPVAMESARNSFLKEHEAVFERWFEKLQSDQRRRAEALDDKHLSKAPISTPNR
jgi:hypothetical protein